MGEFPQGVRLIPNPASTKFRASQIQQHYFYLPRLPRHGMADDGVGFRCLIIRICFVKRRTKKNRFWCLKWRIDFCADDGKRAGQRFADVKEFLVCQAWVSENIRRHIELGVKAV